MTITLIENHEYEFLLDIQKRFPRLTLENQGYEYIDKNKFTEEDLKAWKDVEDLLRKSIKGFTKFNNFCHVKNELSIRFQYHYSEAFTGVGYLLVIELLKGFKPDKHNAKLSDIVIGVRFKHHDDEFDYTVHNVTDDIIEVIYEGELVQFTLEDFKTTILPFIILLDEKDNS